MDAGPLGLVRGELAAMGSSGDLTVVAIAACAMLLLIVAVVGVPRRLVHALRRLLLPGLLLGAAGCLYLGYGALAPTLGATGPAATLPVSAGTILLVFAAVIAVAPTAHRSGSVGDARASARGATHRTRGGFIWGAARTARGPMALSSRFTHPTAEAPAFSTRDLREEVTSEQTLLRVLSYVVIAEFGVFSSRTFPAPTVDVGLAFGLVFLALAVLFIRASYSSTARGVGHLLIATLFGFLLSVVLGHYWSAMPTATLLSVSYFRTTALVAVLTGIAVSLFMGSRR